MNLSLDNITGVVVSYNTKKLLKRSIESIRKFYPTLKIIIVDGSRYYNSCYKYLKSIEDENITTIHVNKNVGHGRGLDLGIRLAETDYILCFDSDIEMISPPLESMIDQFKKGENIYGVGPLRGIDQNGLNVYEKDKNSILYLHPYFKLISKEYYNILPRFVHHGAPCIYTMLALHNKGFSENALISFPVEEYILHDFYGTRNTISTPRIKLKYILDRKRWMAGFKFLKSLYTKYIKKEKLVNL